MNYLLYNPLANNSHGADALEKLKKEFGDKFPDIQAIDYTKKSFCELSSTLNDGDNVIVAGGDGTVNFFANDYKKAPTKNINCYLFPSGTGNDFVNDIREHEENDRLIPLEKYLKSLPKVKVNDKVCYYVNNVGYGLDGMVCEVADDQKAKGKKKINYTTIALSLLLYKYKRPNATVTVDGVTKEYKKVWISPAMNGRYYGGGMKAAPFQDRLSGNITCAVMYGGSRLKTIFAFLGIFKGTHIKHKEMIEMHVGKHIEVTFDQPCALQIDGETIRGVTHFEAWVEE